MRRVNSSLWVTTAVLGLGLGSAALAGGVTTSSDLHTFYVYGNSAAELVRYMNGHALQGDHGNAYANIRPDYDLQLTTRNSGNVCRPASVGVSIRFDETLPVAVSPLHGRTRTAWNGFVSFARAHEAHHKASYVGCAQSFLHEARREAAPSCYQLEATLQSLLYEMRRSCEVKQRPFDQSQARILTNLALFSMARYQNLN